MVVVRSLMNSLIAGAVARESKVPLQSPRLSVMNKLKLLTMQR